MMADSTEQIKARFRAEGVSIAEWARARGFSEIMVYRVLAGTVKGTRGEAHNIAVALGLKPAPNIMRFRKEVPA
jgi:gp16 family phage-associated protein